MKSATNSAPFLPRKGRWPVSLAALFWITVCLAALLAAAEMSGRTVLGKKRAGAGPGREAEDRAAAAEEHFEKAARYLAEEKKAEGFPVRNGWSGQANALLGEEWTPLVTTLGNLESKHLASRAVWARVLTQELHRIGIRQKDTVAAGFSGSFPGLNLALITACQALGARLIAISSVTASSFGANQPGFTWPEMEARLYRAGLIRPASAAISIGGEADCGEGLDSEARLVAIDIRRKTALALGASILDPPDLPSAISWRMDLYHRLAPGHGPSLYVNIGGNAASMGSAAAILRQGNGWLRALPFDFSPERGVMARFAERNIPVLHLLNIRGLARRWGVPPE